MLLASAPAGAQQRSNDVGGQPARRKLTKLPRLTTFIEAEYPTEKKAAGIEGAVILTIEITASGSVSTVSVAQSAAPDFDAAAVAAARQLVFEPAEVDDKPAPAKITFRYAFTLAPPVPVPVRVPVPVSPGSRGAPLPLELPTASGQGAASAAAHAEASSPTPPPSPDTIEVRGRPTPRRELNQTTVAASEARKVAGTQGDVLKVVQNLPGVSRPPLASGQLVVWGSAPQETRVYVDGVDIPALYHGSGLRSVINSDLVSTVDLVPGAFGAEYGRGLGGLVRVETRTLPQGTHGYVGADTLDGSGLVSTDLGEHARIALALRQSWLDRVLAATSAPDVGDFFPIPRYRDGQLKTTIDLRRGESLDLVLLGATDDLTRTVPSADPASSRSEKTHTGFWRAYLRYGKVTDDGDAVTITPFVGFDASTLRQQFGDNPTLLDIGSTRYGLRASMRSKLTSWLGLTTGIDALGSSSDVTRHGSLTLPAREGDITVFGQPPGDDYASDTWTTNILNVAPNVTADVRLGPVTLSPGLRADAFLIEGNKHAPTTGTTPPTGYSRLESDVDPRLAARWSVDERLAFTAAYGTYHQAPEPEDLSSVFGTPDLAPSRATHVSVGETLHLTSSLVAEVIAFDKTMQDLVVRSRLTNPLLARSLTQNGQGRSYGLQLLLRQELWKGFFGWVSYAITRSERRNDGDERWRLFDFDQPHVLSVVASQDIGRWGFGARFRYASGNPRTPVIGSTYDSRDDRYDPVFGGQNTIRIPAFWQLDLRVERSFPLGERLRLSLYADVQNVTNRQNAEEIVYSATFRERSTIRGLPTIAVVGVRLEL